MARAVSIAGYEEASVERVLEEAGISRRTFYELFADREDCFVAAYEAALERVFDTIDAACAVQQPPEQRIEAALEAVLGLFAADPHMARLCVVEVFAAGSRARERRAEAMERMAELLERALAERRGDRRLDRLGARALVGGVHEVIYGPIDRHDAASLPGLGRAIVESQILPQLAARE